TRAGWRGRSEPRRVPGAAPGGVYMKFRLEITAASGRARVFEHEGPVVCIGRDPRCDLALDPADQGVSWRHARIDLTPEGPVLQDLGSTNGTFLNDHRTQGPVALRPGDVIGLGVRGPRIK